MRLKGEKKKRKNIGIEDDNSKFRVPTLDENDEADNLNTFETAKANLKPNDTISKGEEVVENIDEKTRLRNEKNEEKQRMRIERALKKQRLKAIKKQDFTTVVRYDTDPVRGLSQEIVEQRTNDGFVNFVAKGSTKSIKKIVLSNLFTFFNILTLSIAVWLITIQSWKNLLFMVIVTANVVIGIIQEIRAKKTIDRLSLLSAPTAFVRRDDDDVEISVSEVVLDDLLVLDAGKQICSDCIVLDGMVEVNEALLTGESDAIIKKTGDTLYSGSFVVSGNCRARVDKIGKDNYIEKLSSQARKYQKPKSDLMRSLTWIIRVMAIVIIPIGALLFVMMWRNTNFGFMDSNYKAAVEATAGAMIGMIPSGLYLLTSVALAVGVIRLAQNNVLVQELYCIEMLARVNVLCLDKTGTITDGTMAVKNVIEFNPVAGISTKNIISAMLNALNEKNLTSVALEEKFGRGKRIRHIATIPFSSQRKFNAVTFDKIGTFALGAPEFVYKDGYKNIEKEVNKYASDGYRVLLLIHKNGTIVGDHLPEGETDIVSLILIQDNVRPDAVNTINYFKKSGVEVKVISGDNPITVSKISERAGIVDADRYISLDGLTDADVIRAASKYTVFGRVSPAQKKLLVKTLKDTGHIVAMTGDGVNDILALREADCSIAVASGSEAARNVSHLVLLDSNFDSMPKVVAEGRRVINNVASVACLFLTKTIFSFLLAIQALNSGGDYPITPSQLTMIDFFCIGIPSFVLVLEPNNREVDGRFLFNIFKGAIPGALSILMTSIIVFSLSGKLNLNSQSTSTIIVIVATHTCMMVLFKVCKPFNLLRKVMCGILYSLFILFTIFLPNFLNFAPLTDIVGYYSKTYKVETLRELPKVSISNAGYYVIDGQATEYKATSSDYSFILSSTDDEKLIINDTKTDYKIKKPSLSIDKDGNFILAGMITNIQYSVNQHLILQNNGDVHIQFQDNPSVFTGYNILPKIEIGKDGKYIINGVPTTINSKEKEIQSVKCNTIVDESGKITECRLVVNNEELKYSDKDASEKYLLIDVPSFSYNKDNLVVIGGFKTSVTKDQLETDSPTISINSQNSYYLLNNTVSNISVSSGVNLQTLSPSIQLTEEGHYIIDGKYTNYLIKGDRNNITLSRTKDGFLKINGVQTDYKILVDVGEGGQVQRLPVAGLLLMFALCLSVAPLMNIIQGIVPWIKRQYKNIAYIISRL